MYSVNMHKFIYVFNHQQTPEERDIVSFYTSSPVSKVITQADNYLQIKLHI